MAHNRLAPLLVALLGLIVPIIGAEHNRYKAFTDPTLLVELGETRHKVENIRLILDAIVNPDTIEIGDLTVTEIKRRARSYQLYEEKCLEHGVVKYNENVGDMERRQIENVHIYIHHELLSYCANHIEKVFDLSMKADTGASDSQTPFDPECTRLERTKELVNSILSLNEVQWRTKPKTFQEIVDERNLAQKERDCVIKNLAGHLQALRDLVKSEKYEQFEWEAKKLIDSIPK